jgi:hypothetical protein
MTIEGCHFTTNEDAEAAVWTFVHTQDTNFTKRGSSSLWSRGMNESMSVGTMLKNSWLMPRFTHINVYLVHIVSCRCQTRETYFLTIPRSYNSEITGGIENAVLSTHWYFLQLIALLKHTCTTFLLALTAYQTPTFTGWSQISCCRSCVRLWHSCLLD